MQDIYIPKGYKAPETEAKKATFVEKARPIAKKVGKALAVAGAVVGALTIGRAIGKKEAGEADFEEPSAPSEEMTEG